MGRIFESMNESNIQDKIVIYIHDTVDADNNESYSTFMNSLILECGTKFRVASMNYQEL